MLLGIERRGYGPGRKYVLKKADKSRTSFMTTEIFAGESARARVISDKSVLEIGMVVAWRMRSGIGRGGAVMRRIGMPKSSVAA